jgi:hypothetical protein
LTTEAREAALRVAQQADADALRKCAQVIVHCPEYQLI